MKTKHYVFLTVLAVALIAILVGRLHRNVSTAAPAPEPEPVLAAPEPTTSPEPIIPETRSNPYSTYVWNAGARGCWQFGVTLRIASSLESLPETAETRTGGRLQWVVLKADAQRVTIAAALMDTWFESAGRRNARLEEFFNGTPAILTLTPAGNLIDLALPPHLADEDRNLLRLVYGWEFAARPLASYQEVEQTPDDTGSRFRAVYRRTNDRHINKTRLFQPASGTSSDAMQYVVSSQFRASVGSLWVSEMSGWEDTVVALNDTIMAASRVAVSLKQETNSPPLTSSLAALLARPGNASGFTKLPEPTAGRESLSQALRRDVLIARWGTIPFEQVLNPIQSKADNTLQELAQPLKDFEEWLGAHPQEGPSHVLRALQTLSAEQGTLSGLLINSLAEADTPQAREAIATILGAPDAFSATTLLQATDAAGDFGEKATPALKETVAGLMDSPISDGSYRLSDTALFSFARMAKDDGAARAYLLQRIDPWLQGNAAPVDTVKALGALANAVVEDDALVRRAAEYVGGANTDVRLAAMEYLRVLPGSSPGRVWIDQVEPE